MNIKGTRGIRTLDLSRKTTNAVLSDLQMVFQKIANSQFWEIIWLHQICICRSERTALVVFLEKSIVRIPLLGTNIVLYHHTCLQIAVHKKLIRKTCICIQLTKYGQHGHVFSCHVDFNVWTGLKWKLWIFYVYIHRQPFRTFISSTIRVRNRLSMSVCCRG